MFDISYNGANSVTIAGKSISIVTDPKLSIVGVKDLKVKDCIELATESRFAINSDDARLVVSQPGEYEVGDFVIKGIATGRHIDADDTKAATIYRVECGNVAIGILGNIAPKLDDDQLEQLGLIDILVVPVGGAGYTLDATSAASLVRSIDPKVVVPIHYADDRIRYEVPQDSVDVFTKELGAPVEQAAKLKVKNDTSLPPVLTTFVLQR